MVRGIKIGLLISLGVSSLSSFLVPAVALAETVEQLMARVADTDLSYSQRSLAVKKLGTLGDSAAPIGHELSRVLSAATVPFSNQKEFGFYRNVVVNTGKIGPKIAAAMERSISDFVLKVEKRGSSRNQARVINTSLGTFVHIGSFAGINEWFSTTSQPYERKIKIFASNAKRAANKWQALAIPLLPNILKVLKEIGSAGMQKEPALTLIQAIRAMGPGAMLSAKEILDMLRRTIDPAIRPVLTAEIDAILETIDSESVDSEANGLDAEAPGGGAASELEGIDEAENPTSDDRADEEIAAADLDAWMALLTLIGRRPRREKSRTLAEQLEQAIRSGNTERVRLVLAALRHEEILLDEIEFPSSGLGGRKRLNRYEVTPERPVGHRYPLILSVVGVRLYQGSEEMGYRPPNFEIFKLILDELRDESVNRISYSGYSALMMATHYSQPLMVKELLKRGALPNQRAWNHNEGFTSLHYAAHICSQHTPEIIDQLLKAGADPFLKDLWGKPAFVRAYERKREGGADCSKGLFGPWLDRAKSTGSFESAIYNGQTGLETAARFEDLTEIKAWLEAGADINHASKENRHTPLHWVAASCQNLRSIKIMDYLLERGANIHARDWLGETPEELARSFNKRPCAKYLALHRLNND